MIGSRPINHVGIGIILVLVGCSGPTVHVLKAPDPKLLPGWNLYSDAQDGVKVGLPPSWRVGVDTTLSGLQTADDISQNSGQSWTGAPNRLADLKNKMRADDKAEEREALAKLREKGTLINAIDSSKPIPGEQRTRFYVKKVDHDRNWSLDAARDDEVEFYRGWGAEKPRKVQIPLGPAYLFRCDYRTRGGDEVMRMSYVVVDEKETYLLRFVSTNNPQAVTSIAQQVAESWRINRSG